MSRVEALHPDGNDFDRFLFACVGEDSNGTDVTVVSALARLGLDPWKEAAELAVLGQEAARARLGTLLSGVKDVPALGREHGAVAARLAMLLPEHLSHRVSKLAGPTIPRIPTISFGWVLAALIVFSVLARVYVLANPG